MSFHKGLHVAGNTSILNTLEHIEEGRSDIYKWSERRLSKRQGIRGKIFFIQKLLIDRYMLKTFAQNFSLIVAFQMLLAELDFDVHMALFVSPVIFPLAFSINADFQRREKVLEDLALFKGALVVLFFCHRDWLTAAGLAQDFLKTVTNKLRGLILNIKEYLLTENLMRRQFILSVIYEDISDISQLNDKMRSSELPNNSPLITRLVHYHNLMCWAFERLRVVREYRSPRTIRSFTKVFIFLMPLLLSPYYVHIGKKSGNHWSPYYVAVLSSFIFGSLQGVQDVLDDPFDGISEDDINLGQLEDWTMQSLLTNRTFHVGRFTVTTSVKSGQNDEAATADHNYDAEPITVMRKRSILKRSSSRKDEAERNRLNTVETEARYPEVVSRMEDMEKRGLTGSTTILPGFQLKKDPPESPSTSSVSLVEFFKRKNGLAAGSGSQKSVTFDDALASDSTRWKLGSDETETDAARASSIANPEPVPENLRQFASALEHSDGTSLVGSRAQDKEKRRPGLADMFGVGQQPAASAQALSHSDTSLAEMPQSLSSLFAMPERDSAPTSSTPTECRRCSCENVSSPSEKSPKSLSLPSTPVSPRRSSTPGPQDLADLSVIPSSPEASPAAADAATKPRFAVAPAVKSEGRKSSCPVSVPYSEAQMSPRKTSPSSKPEEQPLMTTPSPSYGMTSSSPTFDSKPSRFSVAKSPGTNSSPGTQDTVEEATDANSIEMVVRNAPRGNNSVDDILNLSHDDSEVFL